MEPEVSNISIMFGSTAPDTASGVADKLNSVALRFATKQRVKAPAQYDSFFVILILISKTPLCAHALL